MRVVGLIVICILAALFVPIVANMPSFGDPDAPVHNEVSHRYINESLSDTGAYNSVTAILLDYRAYDTLGEATVLFTAVISMMAIIAASRRRDDG